MLCRSILTEREIDMGGRGSTAERGSGLIGGKNAERMAEAFGFGFSRGSKSGVQFIKNLSKSRRKR